MLAEKPLGWLAKGTLIVLGVLVMFAPPIGGLLIAWNQCSVPIDHNSDRKRSGNAELDANSQTHQTKVPKTSSTITQVLQSIHETQKAQYLEAQRPEPTHSWWHTFGCELRLTDFLIALFTYWLVVVTAGLIYTGYRQEAWSRKSWKAARYANGVARNAFLSVNRPEIRLKHLWFGDEGESDNPTHLEMAIVNVGNTTAMIREFNVTNAVVPVNYRLPSFPKWPDDPKTIETALSALNSGMTLHIKNAMKSRIMTDAEYVSVYNSRDVLFCYGYIEYADLLGGIRKTAFCRVLDIPMIESAKSVKEHGRFVRVEDPDYEYQD